MNAIPSLTILAGILAALALPLTLALLSHGVWKIQAPGARFFCASLMISAIWGLFLAAQEAFILSDVMASLLIWLTALLVGFSFWSLVAWGFTLSLLVSLARAEQPLTLDEWMAAYTGGGNVESFAQDRLSLLLRLRLARLDGEYVRLASRWATLLACLVGILRRLFGVQ